MKTKDIVWSDGYGPSSSYQNHYIFDEDREGKTIWMKEKIKENEEGILKIYFNFEEGVNSKENIIYNNILLKIEEYIDKKYKNKEDYIFLRKECFNNVLDIKDIFLFLNSLVEFKIFSKVHFYVDNIDLLSQDTISLINDIVSYRERELVIFLGIGGKEENFKYFTNTPNPILEGHDYFKFKVIDILKI